MDPNVWGPPLWDLLFTVSFRIGEEEVADFTRLTRLMEYLLPCPSCRRSYTLFRKQISSANLSRSPSEWLWTIHDMVNQKLGKVCISYPALRKRHSIMTLLTSDMLALDSVCLVACAAPEKHGAHLRDFVRLLGGLCERHVSQLRHTAGLRNLPEDTSRVLEELNAVRNECLAEVGAAPLSLDQLRAHFAGANA